MDLRFVPDHCAIDFALLDAFVRQLQATPGKVFVHCIGGISRSPSFVAAYLAFSEGITVDQAFEQIRRCRPQIQPHPAQVASVKAFLMARARPGIPPLIT